MPPPKEKKGRDKRTTLALCLSCLTLGIPVAGVAINLESTPFVMPKLAPGTQIQTTPHVALYAAAILSIVTCVVVMLSTVSLRHMTPNNVPVGLGGFGLAGLNFAAQLIILALIYISVFTHKESKSRLEVTFANGVYDAKGKEFTRETWSCMMGNLYLSQEPWSTNACSEYHYARYTTILMVVTGFLLFGIAYWPVRKMLFKSRSSAPASKV